MKTSQDLQGECDLTAPKNDKKNVRAAGAKSAAAKSDEAPKKETTLEFIASMAAVLITGLFIITFNLQAFEIPSSSMENTLLVGDHVFVDRLTFAPKSSWMPLVHYRNVQRGDIFVFLSPIQPGLYVVKRVIGIPGDHIHLENGILYRNGKKIDEPYVDYEGGPPDPYAENFPRQSPDTSMVSEGASPGWRLAMQLMIQSNSQNGDIVVPKDSYFAMGDHRNVSFDSRYWGFVPKENIIGRPMFIYWSFKTPEGLENATMGERLHFMLGHELLHFFDETVWSRTLRRVR